MRRPRLLLVALGVAAGVVGCTIPVGDGGEVPTRQSDGTVTEAPAPPSGATDDAPEDDSTAAGTRLFLRMEFDPISDDQLAAIGALPGVTDVVARRTDDVALWSSARSDGTPVDDLPEGFKISLAAAVEGDDVPVDVPSGEVVLTRAALQFRDLDVGATIELSDRVVRRVAAITDEPSLQDVEVVLDAADADAMGVRVRQRAVVDLALDADADAVTAATLEILGANGIVQQRPAEARPYVLSLPATKARFGEFAFKDLEGRDIQQGVSWIREYIAEQVVPIIGDVNCNREILPDLVAALETIQERGLAGEIDPSLYGGCWSPRRINKNANLSRHAWGIAFDINVDFDAPGLGPIPSEGLIEAFEEHGFRWGGDYPIPDNHHFEWVGQG